MFEKHQPAIQEFCLKSDANAERLFLLVLLSIRQPFHRMQEQFKSVATYGWQESPALFGWKREGFRYVKENISDLRQILANTPSGFGDVEALLNLTKIPGISLVKGGFCLQLGSGSVGCLDTHNVQRFGLNENAFRISSNASDKLKKAKGLAYLEACWKHGGCEDLWNTWCEYVSNRNKFWVDANHVSEYHAQTILGDF